MAAHSEQIQLVSGGALGADCWPEVRAMKPEALRVGEGGFVFSLDTAKGTA